MKFIVSLILFVVLSTSIKAQELNCQVSIITDARLEVTTVEKEIFEQLKQKPFILNSSRGKVIHTEDLIFALTNQLISGAALDVLENEHLNSYNELEKKNFEFLVQQKNVIITPHIAGYSKEATYKMSRVLLEKLDII